MNHSTAVFERSYQAVHTQVPLAQLTFGNLAGEDSDLIKWTSSVLSRCDANAPVHILQEKYNEWHKRNDMRLLDKAIRAAAPGLQKKKLQERKRYILSCLETLQLAKDRKAYFEKVDRIRGKRENPASELERESKMAPRKQKPMPSCKTAMRISLELQRSSSEPIVDTLVRYLRGEPDDAETAQLAKYACILCTPRKSFATEWNLARHTDELHKEYLSKTFHCPECRQQGKRQEVTGAPAWARHLDECHKELGIPKPRSNSSQRQPCCPWCQKGFTAFGFLRHYNKKHQGNYSFPFDCPICKRGAVPKLTVLANDDAWCRHLIDSHAGGEFQPYAFFPEDLQCLKKESRDSQSGAAISPGLKRNAHSDFVADEKNFYPRKKRSRVTHKSETLSDSAIEGWNEDEESWASEQDDDETWSEELSDSERSSDEEGYGTMSDD